MFDRVLEKKVVDKMDSFSPLIDNYLAIFY